MADTKKPDAPQLARRSFLTGAAGAVAAASVPPGAKADLVPGRGDSPHAVPTKKSFVFIGDKHGHGPDKIKLFGVEFEKNGKAVEVKDPHGIAKLSNNSHFKAA